MGAVESLEGGTHSPRFVFAYGKGVCEFPIWADGVKVDGQCGEDEPASYLQQMGVEDDGSKGGCTPVRNANGRMIGCAWTHTQVVKARDQLEAKRTKLKAK